MMSRLVPHGAEGGGIDGRLPEAPMGKERRREECPREMVAQCPTDKTAPLCNQSQGQSTLLSSFCLDFLESRKPKHIRTGSREKERDMF